MRKAIFVPLLLLIQLNSLRAGAAAPSANSPALPLPVPAGRPVIGLALEGGNAYGLAEIGVLQWMEEHRIPIDRIAGTSMGALIGALYSGGMTPGQLRAVAESDTFTHVFTFQTPYSDASFRRREDRRDLLQALSVGLKGRPELRNALLTDYGMREFMTEHLAAYNRADLEFDRLPIPFLCVATDLNTMDRAVLSHGSLMEAVRASVSMPGVFTPVQAPNGHTLVDGGILDNLPAGLVRRELHADKVIAVFLDINDESNPDTSSIVQVLTRAFDAGIMLNVRASLKEADLVIRVPLKKFTGMDYARGGQLVEAGYRAAEQNRDALLSYALEPAAWAQYLAERKSRIPGMPGRVREVRVDGASPAAIRNVSYDARTLLDKPLEAAPMMNVLKRVQSNGGITATWQSFTLPPPPPEMAGAAEPGDTGVTVHLHPDTIGPPYVLIRPEAASANSNITRLELRMRLVDQNLGGFGSELRSEAQVGWRTDLKAEYYRPIAPGGWFLQPSGRLAREPVYLWEDQKRTGEYFQQTLETGVDLGRTFSNELQVAAEWRGDLTRWSQRTGTGGGPYLDGSAQTAQLHLVIDRAQAGAISPNGFRLTASVGAFYQAEHSDNAPFVHLTVNRSHAWRNDIFGMSAVVNSYLRTNVAEPYRFTLGGPLRLSASSFDEYRGTDTGLARMGLLHRIAMLPTGAGEGLYTVFGYEAGEVWSPEKRAFLRQDGLTGLVANTPVGLFTVGVSVGDAGRRKVFVTLGRWF